MSISINTPEWFHGLTPLISGGTKQDFAKSHKSPKNLCRAELRCYQPLRLLGNFDGRNPAKRRRHVGLERELRLWWAMGKFTRPLLLI